MLTRFLLLIASFALFSPTATAERREALRFGDFEQWVTRHIKESRIIGGANKTVYEIGPTATIDGDKAYSPTGGSPWATSNVMAKVCGITKTSNAVFPDSRDGGGRCCKMTTIIEKCKAIGIININVLVAGSIFTGRMFEPISSTSEPYSKMEMGVPFTKRPTALVFDYKVFMPAGNTRTYSSGFSKQRTLQGHENAEAFIILQRRWEDADGNLFAKRVGTGRERFSATTNGWVNGHHLTVHYGDITNQPFYKSYMGLITGDHRYYARNSKGKMVPVTEVGWDSADATPTHLLVMFSAASGEAYVGTVGLTLWVDNVQLAY